MRRFLVVFALLFAAAGCSNDDSSNNGDNNGSPDSGSDDTGLQPDAAPEQDAAPAPDAAQPDVGGSFCELVDCTPERPFCSELLNACVGCLSSNDCTEGSLQTCDNVALGDEEEPSHACVECVDDSICGGGTCDLATHTCVP